MVQKPFVSVKLAGKPRSLRRHQGAGPDLRQQCALCVALWGCWLLPSAPVLTTQLSPAAAQVELGPGPEEAWLRSTEAQPLWVYLGAHKNFSALRGIREGVPFMAQ